MGNGPRWLKDSITGKVSDGNFEKGEAVFSSLWMKYNNGEGPPSPLLMGRADGQGEPRVVTTSIETASEGDIAGYDIQLKDISESQRRDHIVISVSTSFFRALANGETNPYVDVKFKKAGFGSRVNYVPGAKGALIAAVATLVAAASTAILAIVNGVAKPSAPLWLVTIVTGIVFIGAIIVFMRSVRDRTKPSANSH